MELIKFTPIYKPTLWGGETWLISAIKGSESVALGGAYHGKTLPELVATYGHKLVGSDVYVRHGKIFPLLFKIIDAQQDLSIQVHPDDDMAMRQHGKLGKNEMWYVLRAKEDASIIDGLRRELPESEYASAAADGSIEHYLNKIKPHPGDVLYIPAGRIHGIGGGTYLAEIQQSSDVTYRLYDYRRTDAGGKQRELHIDLARQAADLKPVSDVLTPHDPQSDTPFLLIDTPYFTVNEIVLTRPMLRTYADARSFRVLMLLDGECALVGRSGAKLILKEEEAVLIPACIGSVEIIPRGKAKLLETFV